MYYIDEYVYEPASAEGYQYPGVPDILQLHVVEHGVHILHAVSVWIQEVGADD
jgi:hypothetical protein